MALIRKLFWVALFLVSTFGFVVLFDHGTTNYGQNARLEFEELKKLIHSDIKKSDSDKPDAK